MKNLKELMIEDTPLSPVNSKAKQGWLFLAGVMIGCTICVPVFVMGAGLAHQLPYMQFVVASILGGSLAAFIAFFTGLVGQKTGLPTATLAKIAFGTRGHFVANAVLAIAAIGWFGIQTGVFSSSLLQLAKQVWGIELNLTAVTVLSGLVMSTTAIIGFRGLGKLSYISVPLLLILLFLPLYVLLKDGQLENIGDSEISNPISFGQMIAMVAGAYSFSATMPDLTRFMKNKKSTAIGIFSNFVVAYPLLLILTGTIALASGNSDYMQVMLGLGFGGLAIVVLFLATWTTNDANVYCASLSVNLFLDTFPRWKIAAAVGCIGTIFAVMGIFEHFTDWLIFSGNLFGPMAGVYVIDYWMNKERYSSLENIPRYRIPQLVSWLVGFLVGSLTTSTDNMGLGLMSLTTVPMLDGMLSAAFVQCLLQKLSKKAAPQ